MRLSRWSPGCGSPKRDVGLAEEVVQLGVEARQPDARADAERVRENAGAPVRVDGDHVRRVLAALRPRFERLDEREHALGLREPGEPRKPREELRDAREAAAGRDAATGVLDDDRVTPQWAVVGEVVGE